MFCSLTIPIGFNTALAGRAIFEAGAEEPLLGERGIDVNVEGTCGASDMEGLGEVSGETAILPRQGRLRAYVGVGRKERQMQRSSRHFCARSSKVQGKLKEEIARRRLLQLSPTLEGHVMVGESTDDDNSKMV